MVMVVCKGWVVRVESMGYYGHLASPRVDRIHDSVSFDVCMGDRKPHIFTDKVDLDTVLSTLRAGMMVARAESLGGIK